jgi:GNAT superfamily N-acetyltransferase
VSLVIRRARTNDAAAACLAVRRSIAELCTDDHRGDEATLAAWLANKTDANFEQWISSVRHIALVAESANGVVGFALVNLDGEIVLLYVSPKARFQGVSKALLGAVEREALHAGMQTLTLNSTTTARQFYRGCGFVTAGEPCKGFGISTCYPLTKRLVA